MRYFAHRWGDDVLWRLWLPSSHRVVALTIDDAPSDYSPDILRALAASGARATFFVVGSQVPGREAVLRDIVRAGHELANHGMHDEPARTLSDAELERQIRDTQRYIDDAYWYAYHSPDDGPPPDDVYAPPRLNNYYRPGSGFFSARMRALMRKLGRRIVLGSIYPHDAQIGYWWVNAKHILSMLSPGGIIICHDRRSWTVPMLQKVLPEMQRRGYRAVTITELLDEGAALAGD
ncbi:carbohydrate esterase family 4 protein [Lasiosphaeria miniovina]|uniref:chitin deacetylase n=1 Tax=Lasiosphaeria miniovina TaxID=1954250 RepID=A0AA40DUN6_9PEZI|nr:carbohydrate esterase family 4 protein [Lasiosphaeria miniovina]KAK0717034.1 carbohydrate esterase family 4 protein [Lasiosphaeria miniovina]